MKDEQLNSGRIGHAFGVASLCLFALFWRLVTRTVEPGESHPGVYFVFVGLPLIVFGSLVCSIVAMVVASRWWITIGIVTVMYGVLWFGTAGV